MKVQAITRKMDGYDCNWDNSKIRGKFRKIAM
jgi:hypothetical protein